ncbi:MAG: trigger factor [Candidatus Moranbacteria bacterium]|nr:trigger factor [Candidatus Moranbacteria bacterium]
MDVNVKKLPKSTVELAVSIPWDEWKGEIDHAAAHLSEQVKVEGFRKGKVPREVLEKKLGKSTVLLEGAEHAIDHLFPQVLREAGVDGIGRPEIRLDDVKEEGALEFTVTVAVMPKAGLKGWSKAVSAVNAGHAKEEVAVPDEEVERELDRLAKSRAKLVTVDRVAREGDAVEVDFDVTRGGVAIEGGAGRKHPIVLGSGTFIPGFEERVIGMEPGTEQAFTLTFPSEYHEKTLAGKPAEFRVKLLLVQEREIPELTDDFAKSLGRFEDLAALRKSISEGMLAERREQAAEKRRTDILEALVGEVEAELPDVLVENELRRMIGEFSHQASMTGLSLSDYLDRIGKSENDLAAEWKPQAEKRVLSQLALEAIAAEREIEVASEEIESEMNKVLAYVKSVRQAEKDLDLPAIYASIRERLRNEKVFALLESL